VGVDPPPGMGRRSFVTDGEGGTSGQRSEGHLGLDRGWDALDTQVLPSCARPGQGTQHGAGTRDASPAGAAHRSPHHHPAPVTVKQTEHFWAGFCQ